MTAQRLYNTFELLLSKGEFNYKGIWNQISYSTKMLTCQRLIESGKWKSLPEYVLDALVECELDVAV